MPLSTPAPVDTRHFFRPVSSSLVALLRAIPLDHWDRPTVAGTWTVRDVVAHLLDTTLRRLSFHRDRMAPPPPSKPIASERDFVDFINGINADWVTSSKRLSPQVLTDLFELAARDSADWFEALPIEAPALFGVSWAGEMTSEGWFDIGREFTELWHHQQQIRMAVGADSLGDSRYLAAVIDVAMRGLPHAFRDVPAETGEALTIEVAGASGGAWTLRRDENRWTLLRGVPLSPAARVRLTDDNAWKLLFNALRSNEIDAAVAIEGRAELGRALLRARSIVI